MRDAVQILFFFMLVTIVGLLCIIASNGLNAFDRDKSLFHAIGLVLFSLGSVFSSIALIGVAITDRKDKP